MTFRLNPAMRTDLDETNFHPNIKTLPNIDLSCGENLGRCLALRSASTLDSTLHQALLWQETFEPRLSRVGECFEIV